MDREETMKMWDSWRKYISEGGGGSWPRDAFESVLEAYDEEIEFLKEVIKAQDDLLTSYHLGKHPSQEVTDTLCKFYKLYR